MISGRDFGATANDGLDATACRYSFDNYIGSEGYQKASHKWQLLSLPVSAAGRAAVDVLLGDLRKLREHARDPVLNCIHHYPRDEEPGPVRTDVYFFHADSAPMQSDTWLCTYHGPASEGLRNEEALRRVEARQRDAAVPASRTRNIARPAAAPALDQLGIRLATGQPRAFFCGTFIGARISRGRDRHAASVRRAMRLHCNLRGSYSLS